MHWRTRLQLSCELLKFFCLVVCVSVGIWCFAGLLFWPDELPIPQGEPSEYYDDFSRSTRPAMEAAGNRTLGFSSIKFVNMPQRFDRADAATIQAYISGIDLEYYSAVEPLKFGHVGMPPSSNPAALRAGEKGCWRAHASVSCLETDHLILTFCSS